MTASGGRPSAAESVTVTGLTKAFGASPVLRGVDLTIPAGALVALLGPSGCGKTTLLRAIAGLDRADSGEVRAGDRVLTGPGVAVPPERRRIGMVFQDPALFPHMSVARNVGYGLSRRDPDRAVRVAQALELVGLGGYDQRMPSTLSGGEQQRVALARALAPRPSVILLDEPFSNLDAPLRAELRLEVRRVLAGTDMTALFVTHDQEEAFLVGDEVAVMGAGCVAQQGSPTELYELPASREVAEFIGDANFLPGHATGRWASTPVGEIPLHADAEGAVEVMVRPERLRAGAGDDGAVEATEYYGHDAVYRVRLDDGCVLRARIIGPPVLRRGRPGGGGLRGPAHHGLRRSRDTAHVLRRPELSASSCDLLVLGAGPAGLGAAYRAAAAGHRVTLLERAAFVGGAAASGEVAGVRVDLGSHRLHPSIEPRILTELQGLLGDDLQVRPRNGRIRLGGRWIAFPLRPLDLLRRLPPGVAAGALRDAALGPLRHPAADTFSEVLRAALGPTLCERFYFPYARKIWGVDPAELSGEQARRRVGARSPGTGGGARALAEAPGASARSSIRAAATGRSGRRSPRPAWGPGWT